MKRLVYLVTASLIICSIFVVGCGGVSEDDGAMDAAEDNSPQMLEVSENYLFKWPEAEETVEGENPPSLDLYEVLSYVRNNSEEMCVAGEVTITLYDEDSRYIASMEGIVNTVPPSGRWALATGAEFYELSAEPTQVEVELGNLQWEEITSETPSFQTLEVRYNEDHVPFGKVEGAFNYTGGEVARLSLLVVLLDEDDQPIGVFRGASEEMLEGELANGDHAFELTRGYVMGGNVSSIDVSYIWK